MPPAPDSLIEKKESSTSKLIKLLVKILITTLCFWYISKKIDFSQALHALQKANWLFLFFAVLLYIVSKIVAAFRLNIYFKNINLHLKQWPNLKLYWLGMFYNLFLPGSISGDAYKVLVLKKICNAPYKKTSAAVLLDRFTGLLGLGVVLAFYSVIVLPKILALTITGGCFIAVLVAYFVVKKWFRDFLPGFWATFCWGLVVQLFANTSAYFVIHSLGVNEHLNEYMFIFLVASVAAVLPLTLGGLGAREIVFYELSTYFKLDAHSSIIISLLFYFMVVVTSSLGIIYLFTHPLYSQNNHESQVI